MVQVSRYISLSIAKKLRINIYLNAVNVSYISHTAVCVALSVGHWTHIAKVVGPSLGMGVTIFVETMLSNFPLYRAVAIY